MKQGTRAALALCCGLFLWAAGAAAQAPEEKSAAEKAKQEELRRVERQMAAERRRAKEAESQAQALADEIEGLRAQIVLAVRSARTQEATLTELEESLWTLEKEAQEKSLALSERRRDLAALSDAAAALAAQPPAAALLLAPDPLASIRAAMLMEGAAPQLKAKVDALAADLKAMQDLTRRIAQQRDLAKKTSAGLAAERTRLEAAMKRKSELERGAHEDASRAVGQAARLASTARDIKDLLERLEQDRKADEERRREESARRDEERRATAAAAAAKAHNLGDSVLTPGARRTMPAAGRVVQGFDPSQPEQGGVRSRGVTIAPRPGATVAAPGAGTVVFSGPFRGYGPILIIDHGDGYHSLLAGLGRIDVEVGRKIGAGEAVGVMGEAGDKAPALYFELRRNGQPVNPTAWAQRKSE